jgi:hypothetical protein
MATGKCSKVLALFLALMLPCSFIAAESRGAMVFATNSVIVNGSHISKTSAIFPGDKLTVPADAAATIMLNGTSILVPKYTTLTFTGDSVLLEPQGAVAVNTTVGMAAQIKDIKISPAKDGSAKYQVGRYDGQVFVAAKQGTVLIASATGSRVLAEGSTTTFADPEQQKQKKCDDPDQKKQKECEAAQATTGRGAAPATTGVGVGELPTWVAVLIGTAAAGIAAGAAIATTGAPASPIHP